ncbi:rhodanese-like domain-containing protein [Uliginosibacterium sp. sgz301328]|uniref:rhodanese-like domain-containing protein n=1 Tax=Uliginosibacterium sp. sgz301328 TaxID=3243764 RepID=UPI00359E5B2C
MQPISAPDLAAWLADDSRAKPLLLDVREPSEFAVCAIEGATLIPMGTIPARSEELDPEQPIVCICHHGMRSAQVAMFLSQRGFSDLYNLTGGVHAWATQVDPAMPTY